MKQSTFSAVMANKLLTVLQGYTKGIRFTAILTLLFTLGVGSMLGAETWELVTDASTLKVGDELVIVSDGSQDFVAGNISSSVMASVSGVTISSNKTISSLPNGTVILTLGGSSGAWTLTNNSGKKLGATAVKKVAWGSGTTTWSISISSNNATIQSTTSSYGRFLYNVNSPRFTTYTSNTSSSMLLPQLYRKKASCTAPTSVTIDGAWDKFGGETISLTATATGGSGNYTYQWQKYYGSTWNNITDNATATTANLVYENCDGSHSGTYRCVVSTGADCSTASDGLQVKVYTLECYTNGTNIYHFTRNGNAQSGTLTLNLNAKTAYKFMVHVDNDYYGNGGTINKDETNWVLGAELGTPDLTVNSGLGGTFTFTIDYSESGNSNTLGVPEISVTYPRKTIYLNPGVWDTAGAKYAIYYFIDGHDAWSDLFVGDACGTYTTIPQWNGVTMIAVRLNSDATVGTWDKKWNQTDNIAVTNNDYIAITGWGNNGGNSPHTYSTYTPATYSITFYGNGDTGGSMTKVTGITCGENHTLAANGFARTGYTFAGWATSANGEKVYDDKATISNITSNITLYAKWTPNANTAYKVKHYKQQLDGTYSGTPDETDNLTGTTAASVTPAVKSYTGFTAPSTKTVTIAADGSTVVTYQYTRNSYTVTWEPAGGNWNGDTNDKVVEHKYGAEIQAPEKPNRDNYVFVEWDPTYTAGTTMPANNLTYTAQWKKKHTIKWIVNGDTDTPYATTYVVDGDALALPSNPNVPSTCEEKVFIGWTESATVNADGSDIEYVDENTLPNTDKTYYAVFASPDANGAGGDYKKVTSALSDWSGEYLIVYEAGNFAFDGGQEQENLNDGFHIDVTIEDDAIAATTEMDNARFTVAKMTGGYSVQSASGYYIGCEAYDKGLYSSQDIQYLNQISWGKPWDSAAEGVIIKSQNNPILLYSTTAQRFRYYSSAQEPIALYRKSSYTDYTTTCVETFKVTYEANGATSGNVPVDENNYILNATVTVLGNTGNLQKTHYSFVKWNTQADGNGTSYQAGKTFTITEDVTLYAIWEELPQYSVTWYVNGKQLTDIELSGASTTVYEGDRITKTPPAPNPEDFCGQVFAGWTDTEMDVNDTNKPTIYNLVDEFPTASGDQTFYAVFADYVTD